MVIFTQYIYSFTWIFPFCFLCLSFPYSSHILIWVTFSGFWCLNFPSTINITLIIFRNDLKYYSSPQVVRGYFYGLVHFQQGNGLHSELLRVQQSPFSSPLCSPPFPVPHWQHNDPGRILPLLCCPTPFPSLGQTARRTHQTAAGSGICRLLEHNMSLRPSVDIWLNIYLVEFSGLGFFFFLPLLHILPVLSWSPVFSSLSKAPHFSFHWASCN